MPIEPGVVTTTITRTEDGLKMIITKRLSTTVVEAIRDAGAGIVKKTKLNGRDN